MFRLTYHTHTHTQTHKCICIFVLNKEVDLKKNWFQRSNTSCVWHMFFSGTLESQLRCSFLGGRSCGKLEKTSGLGRHGLFRIFRIRVMVRGAWKDEDKLRRVEWSIWKSRMRHRRQGHWDGLYKRGKRRTRARSRRVYHIKWKESRKSLGMKTDWSVLKCSRQIKEIQNKKLPSRCVNLHGSEDLILRSHGSEVVWGVMFEGGYCSGTTR